MSAPLAGPSVGKGAEMEIIIGLSRFAMDTSAKEGMQQISCDTDGQLAQSTVSGEVNVFGGITHLVSRTECH